MNKILRLYLLCIKCKFRWKQNNGENSGLFKKLNMGMWQMGLFWLGQILNLFSRFYACSYLVCMFNKSKVKIVLSARSNVCVWLRCNNFWLNQARFGTGLRFYAWTGHFETSWSKDQKWWSYALLQYLCEKFLLL